MTKIENTIENKQKFFAQYFGQKILGHGQYTNHVNHTYNWGHQDFFLRLKPLSAISDEDAIEVAKIMDLGHLSPTDTLVGLVRGILIKPTMSSNILKWLFIFDFLRSSGYLVGWMGLTPEEIIEFGWAKI